VCRKHGLSQGTFYKFKSKYGGMEESDAAMLRALEDENRRQKKVVADLSLDKEKLQDVDKRKL
jgi:putative transposase